MDVVKLNELTEKIIGCAIEVHRTLGPGLLESIYEKALGYELKKCGINFESQVVVPVIYKGENLGEMRLDILVEDEVIVELKAADRVELVQHLAPLLGQFGHHPVQEQRRFVEQPLGCPHLLDDALERQGFQPLLLLLRQFVHAVDDHRHVVRQIKALDRSGGIRLERGA